MELKKDSVTDLSPVTSVSTHELQVPTEAGGAPRESGELSTLERLDILGWDDA